MRSRWLDTAVVLALGTGLLYAGGHYYRQSYLAAFGLSAEQFQKSGEALMLFGFHAGLTRGRPIHLVGNCGPVRRSGRSDPLARDPEDGEASP
ncbi:hypothetical protein J2X52_003117 [Luteimonas sp. 3794]|nr:hypothetical protein [Luteimonas sp. 3794]